MCKANKNFRFCHERWCFMPVMIGTVATFPHPKADKSQVLKIAEEEHEVFSAWENLCKKSTGEKFCDGECQHAPYCSLVGSLVDECADLITATCNLLAALGVDDLRPAMAACEHRNRERGRL